MFDAIWNIKPRLFGLGGVANPRDSYGYRSGLRLAQAKNPSVLFVPSSIKHCTSLRQVQVELPDYAHVAEAPHPSLSPKGRGRPVAPALLPLPLGEGWGEGSRHSLRYVPNQTNST